MSRPLDVSREQVFSTERMFRTENVRTEIDRHGSCKPKPGTVCARRTNLARQLQGLKAGTDCARRTRWYGPCKRLPWHGLCKADKVARTLQASGLERLLHSAQTWHGLCNAGAGSYIYWDWPIRPSCSWNRAPAGSMAALRLARNVRSFGDRVRFFLLLERSSAIVGRSWGRGLLSFLPILREAHYSSVRGGTTTPPQGAQNDLEPTPL